MELTMPPERVGPMRRAYSPRTFVQSEGCFSWTSPVSWLWT